MTISNILRGCFINIENNSNLVFINNVVVFGDQYFLHQKEHAHGQFKYLTGDLDLSYLSIRNFNVNINRNMALSDELGFNYLHVVFPSKPYVYREKFKSIGIDIKSMFRPEHAGCNVIFPELLPEHYDNNDTHTNDLGMTKIISEIMDIFDFPDLPTPRFVPSKRKGKTKRMMMRR